MRFVAGSGAPTRACGDKPLAALGASRPGTPAVAAGRRARIGFQAWPSAMFLWNF
jgi:hypothetical protein